jgi:hypothetical protein
MDKPHRWIAVVSRSLTDVQAARVAAGDWAALLEGKAVTSEDDDLAVGCYDCEESWQAVHAQPCKAAHRPQVH